MNSKSLGALLAIVIGPVIAVVVGFATGVDSNEVGGVPAVLWLIVAAFAVNWIVFVPSWLKRTEVFFDLTGSLTYVTVTTLGLVLADEVTVTAVVMAVLIYVWAGRLGTFLFRRIRADGKDGRFDQIKTDFAQLAMAWTLQGLWVSLTSIAAWTAITVDGGAESGVLTVVGIVVWLSGFAIEVKADQEKSAFRADPSNEGRFISTGLWAWSRHPNYFGEITLWVGMALIALPSLSGWAYVSLVSPLFVVVLLTRISGLPMLERRAMKRWGDDPAYRQYVASTPVLVLRPPRG